MKSALKAILILTVLTPALPLMSFAGGGSGKSIYGEDNRADFFAASADIQELSDSVVSLWNSGKIVFDPASKTYTLKTRKFGDKFNLCPGEKFSEQPVGAFCSGALVGEDLILTAAHCITDKTRCANTKVVFGYAIKKEGSRPPAKIAQGEVYSCKRLVKVVTGDTDYALIRLDRPATGHKALAINRASTLKEGDGVFVIGHPKGLPLKIADDATVRDTAPAGYFVTNLDTFHTNSGSPVFNAKSKLVEGVLVRGYEDFVRNQAGCVSSAVYPQDGGGGEAATKISEFQAFIPKLAVEKEAEAAVSANAVKAVGIGDIDALRGLDAGNISFQ